MTFRSEMGAPILGAAGDVRRLFNKQEGRNLYISHSLDMCASDLGEVGVVVFYKRVRGRPRRDFTPGSFSEFIFLQE